MVDAIVTTSAKKDAAAVLDRGSLRATLWLWAEVSVAGIGGPAMQIATMHRLFVQGKRWISEERFISALSYCIALPGPETQQLAIYIGWLAHRMIGGIIAGVLFIMPGVICMMALCFGYVAGIDSQVDQTIFLGVRPAILAIMTQAILRFGSIVLPTRWLVAIAALAFVAAFFRFEFLIILAVAALLGLCAALAGLPGFSRAVPASIDNLAATHIDDELPHHTRPSTTQFIRSLTIWLTLWLAPTIVLLAILGPENIFTQISLLYSKVAMMAVGGDYAVIAYAAQQDVGSYHWVTTREMQDGIAMGEMVPGTIMIVTQFLGFMAGYRHPGLLPPLLSGTFGGLLATWVTFAPCFLWIIVVAPFIESLRSNAFLNGPLRAVTAAAVGMIVNLTVWFGMHTLFHDLERIRYPWLKFDIPNVATLDSWALVLFSAAAIAILRFKFNVALTLVACSAVGMLLLFFGLTGVRS
ncbi:MAG: chromate efflux transporter [Xanthobacteraceae bacterium]